LGTIEKRECLNRILVVDDNIDIRLLLKKRLETAGYEVVTAENGYEATQSILSTPPCVVILDLMMPVMDGWQFLEWKKKQNSDLANVPVLVVSAVSDFNKPPEGIAGFLKKPVSVNSMIDYIEGFC
jgi:CheY-like chemotaxis protein